MTDAEREKLLKERGWTEGQREDGKHCVRDSSGNQIGTGDSPDAAVAAALEYSKHEDPVPSGSPTRGRLVQDEE